MHAENGQVVWLQIVLLGRVYGKQRRLCLTGNSTGHSPSGISGTGPFVGPPEPNRLLGGCGVGDAEALLGADAVLLRAGPLRGGVLVDGLLAGGGALVGGLLMLDDADYRELASRLSTSLAMAEAAYMEARKERMN